MSGNNVLLPAITARENELLVTSLSYNKAADAGSLETINTAQLGEQHDVRAHSQLEDCKQTSKKAKSAVYYLFLASCVSHAKER